MNPFINPIFLSKVIKSYIVDVKRLYKMNSETLKKFQDKQFRKILEYAYKLPFYNDLYKKAGIKIKDIQGINDITKLPFVTKKEISETSPDNLIPPNSHKTKIIVSYTSGTTGKPVSIFTNIYTIFKESLAHIRTLEEHDIDWRKTRMTIIGDLSENTIDRAYFTDGITKSLTPFFSLNNMQIFDTYDDPEKLIKKINSFQPEFIGGYPGMLRQLAYLKRQGSGKDIWPRCIISTGSVLDKYLKNYIEEAFDTQVFDSYGATEPGPMAFQCRCNNYHVHSDLVFLEVIDDNGEPVTPNEPGHIVVTKLYGEGTPIIRYTGLNDIISLSDESCRCGIVGRVIKKIYGRESQSLVLPNGLIVLPSTLDEFFSETYWRFDIENIERLQIVQHRRDNIEILAVVDHNLRNNNPSVEKVFTIIRECFKERFGSDIEIKIKEVKNLKPHIAGFISKVDISKIKKKKYI